MAYLLEAWWSAEGGEAKEGDDTARALLLLVLQSANVITLEDVVAVNLDQVARRCGYTRRSLERIFKQAVGNAPSGWLMNIRLHCAVRELRSAAPGTRVADVARRWGFLHLARFSKYYRAAFGELPSETLRFISP